jgi:hypothetical protein
MVVVESWTGREPMVTLFPMVTVPEMAGREEMVTELAMI